MSEQAAGRKPEPGRTEVVQETAIGLAEFLESHPPGSLARVRGLVLPDGRSGTLQFVTTDIQVHCPSDKCGGTRIFHTGSSLYSISKDWTKGYLEYTCRNCEGSWRLFAIMARLTAVHDGEVYKIGEYPPFGPPMPARVMSLIGPERDLFLKGRRSENQGLGIGAFVYYRRVVESQWRRLVEEIIRVAERVGAPPTMLANLKQAATESQFSKAVELLGDGVPEALKIGSHNPLTLLYRALSEGLHDAADDHCLDLAGSVRVVLTELAERIGQALKDERELNEAVTKLMRRKQE